MDSQEKHVDTDTLSKPLGLEVENLPCERDNDDTNGLNCQESGDINELSVTNEIAQTFCDEDNTQMITSDVYANEMREGDTDKNECITDVIDSDKVSKFLSHEVNDNLSNDLASESQTEDLKQIHFSEKVNETVEISKDDEESETVFEGNISEASTVDFKDLGNYSQASTQDINLGAMEPHSPDDLFASQSPGKEAQHQSENSLMECEDFIPSSLSQNIKDVNETDGSSDSISATRKRKLEENDKVHTETKVPKMQLSTVTTPGKDDHKESQTNEEDSPLNKEKVMLDVLVKNENTSCTLSLNRESSKQTKGEQEIFKKPTISVKDDEIIFDSSQENEKSGIGRKSLEIVFSSVESAGQKECIERRQNLSCITEENGEDCFETSGSENFHLHISLSPSQATQSFSEVDISKDDEMNAKLSPLKEKCESSSNGNGDMSISCGEENDSSLVNEISTDDNPPQNDSILVHEKSVLIISPEGEKNSYEDTVQSSASNKTEKPFDFEEIVVLDEKKTINTDSESLKHRVMNGSMHENNEKSSDKIVGKHDENGLDKVYSVSNSALPKHHQLLTVLEDDRSTPDLPLLLPNKQNSAVFQLREIDCLFNIKGRVQINEETRQVHSIELYQCLDVDDNFSKNVNHRESSSGYVADESKNSSPSSVSSVGPFALKSQAWRYSSSSTSTTSSGHSGIGRLGSSEMRFTVPLNPPPSRSFKGQNIHYTSEFVRDIFDLVDKKMSFDDSKVQSTSNSLPTTVPTAPISNSHAETSGDTTETHKKEMESMEHVTETPKSSKKSSRGLRNVRSASRNLVSKIQEVKEEEEVQTPPPSVEKDSEEIVGSSKKPRKTPLRSSKRSASNTPASTVVAEENKNSTSTVGTNRSRRNRSEVVQNGKTENGSKEPSNALEQAGRCSKLVPGVQVFARWTDKKYYPGKIKEKTKDGRWIIEFDDRTVRPSKEEFIAPINILPKGQIVFANDEEECEQGIIVEFKVVNNEVQYGVELDSGRKSFFPRSKLFMSEDQARLLQENIDPKSPTTSSPALTTVTCDNIVHHKRPRSNRVLFGAAESPSVSGVLKTPKRSGKIDPSHDTSCSSSVSDTNDKGPLLVLEEVTGVEPEAPSYFSESFPIPSGRGKGPGRIKSKTRTPRKNPSNRSFSDNQERNQLHEQLGPIPEEGSKMFTGMCFLLTQSVVKSVDSLKNSASSKSNKKSDLSGSESEVPTDEGMSNCRIPFVKHHLKKQIEAGGGIVFEHFEDLPEDQYQNTFLVTDRPCLTAKFILCLASGIKIIHHPWIIEEAKGFSRPWSSARMQAGWDLEGQRYVPPEATVRTRKQKPLNRKEVGLVNDSPAFVKFWGRILELMGASVRHINPDQDREFSGVNVIVTDNSCPPEVQERAREWTIPLVSPAWVTQSLINWRIRSYTGHALYRYDYCASE